MLFFAVLGIAYGLVTYHYDRLPFSSTKIYENADDDEIEVRFTQYYLGWDPLRIRSKNRVIAKIQKGDAVKLHRTPLTVYVDDGEKLTITPTENASWIYIWANDQEPQTIKYQMGGGPGELPDESLAKGNWSVRREQIKSITVTGILALVPATLFLVCLILRDF
ncbi:hypothetical protein PAA26_04080 [Methanomassiliicoccaceae archaeon COG_1]|nr:hypothetical protein [Methanomassiliicoccaceae archaeon COG_1]